MIFPGAACKNPWRTFRNAAEPARLAPNTSRWVTQVLGESKGSELATNAAATRLLRGLPSFFRPRTRGGPSDAHHALAAGATVGFPLGSARSAHYLGREIGLADGRWMVVHSARARLRHIHAVWDEKQLGTRVMGVVLAVLLVYVVGVFVGNFIGRTLWRLTEMGVMRIPLVRAIYPSVKQVTDFVLAERKGGQFMRQPGCRCSAAHDGNLVDRTGDGKRP